jgi:hypothetical protein
MIGVLAASRNRAQSVIDQLRLQDARPITLRNAINGHKGTRLDALIVDESALPLPDKARASLLPCLAMTGSQNHIYELRLWRYDQ